MLFTLYWNRTIGDTQPDYKKICTRKILLQNILNLFSVYTYVYSQVQSTRVYIIKHGPYLMFTYGPMSYSKHHNGWAYDHRVRWSQFVNFDLYENMSYFWIRPDSSNEQWWPIERKTVRIPMLACTYDSSTTFSSNISKYCDEIYSRSGFTKLGIRVKSPILIESAWLLSS